MDRWRRALVPAALLGLAFPFLVSVPASSAVVRTGHLHPFVPGELIVAMEPGVTTSQAADLYRDYDLERVENLDSSPGDGHPQESVVDVPAPVTESLIQQLEQDARVDYAEPNYILTADNTPSDPEYGRLWGMNNTGQTGGTPDADIDAPEAWDVTTGSASVIVGVIDTGIDYNHVDLAANVWTNPGEVPGDNLDNDHNGYVDDVHGINAITGSGDPMDDHGHGTHVSGTIGAVGGNGKGVAGLNWTVRIAACKFLNAQATGTTADAIECFKYFNRLKNVAGQNIVVTSNSWGGASFSQALMDAMAGLDQPGMSPILHVAAAGNSARSNDATPHYPDGYNLGNIISVAATDHNDRYASFTNWGAATVDLAAPGVDICSTWFGTPTRPCGSGGSYHLGSGTSMATPHVAGAAAAIESVNPSLSATQLKQRILSTVDPIGQLSGNAGKPTVTNGRLNLFHAVAPPASPQPPAAPTGLTASAVSSTRIDLSWDDVATETGYRVERSPNGTTGWLPVGTTGQNVTVRSDTGLTPNTTYHYRVIATNDGGDSPPSSVASATTPPVQVQSKSYPPTSVTITRGTALGDPVSNLAADDGNRYRVGSVRRGGRQQVVWYGQSIVDVTGVTKLTLAYDGSYTSPVTQTLYVRNFSTGTWEQVSSATVGTTDQTFGWSTNSPAAYISSTGQVRLRVNGTNGVSYTCQGDLMVFTVEY